MKRSFIPLTNLLTTTILNSAIFVLVAFVMAFGEFEDYEILSYHLPNTIIAIVIIIFSLLAKKKGEKGALWLPIIFSLLIFIYVLYTLFLTTLQTFDMSDGAETFYFMSIFIILLLALYFLFRYYFSLHKRQLLNKQF